MPSFEVPEFPSHEYPQFSNQLLIQELAPICNAVYDQHKELIDRSPRLKKALLGGNHPGRVWALHEIKKLTVKDYTHRMAQFRASLKEAAASARASECFNLLHSSMKQALGHDLRPQMPTQVLHSIRDAVEAVYNLEKAIEEGEKRQERQEREERKRSGHTHGKTAVAQALADAGMAPPDDEPASDDTAADEQPAPTEPAVGPKAA